MKREFIGFTFVLMVLFSLPWVIAQENSTDVTTEQIDTEMVKETEVMVGSNYGAKMRMLQLSRAIERRVLWGSEVIETLDEKGEDISRLEEIVEDLGLLAEDAEIAAVDNLDVAVETFLAIKNDAKELVDEFREIARPLLNDVERSELRDKFEELDRSELTELTQEIVDARRNLNAERAQRMLEVIGDGDSTLIEGIRKGSVTVEEVRQRISQQYRKAVQERREIRESFRENVQSAVAERVKAREEAAEKYVRDRVENVQKRIEARQNRINNAIENQEDDISSRLNDENYADKMRDEYGE